MMSPTEPEPYAARAGPAPATGEGASWFEPAQVPPAAPEQARVPVSTAEMPTVAEQASPGRPRPSRFGRWVAVVVLIVLGVAGVAGGSVALGKEFTRSASKAEVAAALAKEIANRWRQLPAGRIFPAHFRYQETQGPWVKATLVGIAAPERCQAALEPGAYQAIRRLGCATMLRATYTNPSGTVAVTVGIGVMASPGAASNAQGKMFSFGIGGGLHALAMPGTIADRFADASRGASGAQNAGPYLILYTAGSTYGQPGSAAKHNLALQALGAGITQVLQDELLTHGAPCQMPDIRC